MSKKVLLIDMDDTICDFSSSDRLKTWKGGTNPSEMYEEGFFESLKPLPGARKAIQDLIASGLYDVIICTQPLAMSVICYTEKAAWIAKYLPSLVNKIIMTQNKLLIKADILIDDDLRWVGFPGEFIHFDNSQPSEIMWQYIVEDLLYRFD